MHLSLTILAYTSGLSLEWFERVIVSSLIHGLIYHLFSAAFRGFSASLAILLLLVICVGCLGFWLFQRRN